MSVLLLVLILTLPLAVFLWRTRYRHLGPCPRGCAGRARWSTDSAYSLCPVCGGSNQRIRPMARIWPKHRAEAQRRKDAIRRQREANR